MALVKPTWPILRSGRHPLAEGLLGAWPVYEGVDSPTLFDLSGNGNNGTITNYRANWIGSPYGFALNGTTAGNTTAYTLLPAISGVGDYTIFVVAGNCQGTTSTTTSIVYSDNFPTSPRNGFGIKTNNGSSQWFYEAYVGGTGTTATVSGALSGDHTLALVRSGTTVTAYLDGKAQATTITVGSGTFTTSNFYLNAHYYSGAIQETFNGSMAGALFYSRALSAVEIAALNADPFSIYRRRSRWWETVQSAAVTRQGQASFAGAGRVIVSGGQEQTQITFAASGSFIALATTAQQFGQVNYNGAGQFLVSGGQEQAQVLFAGAGSLAESSALLEAASASFNGLGSFLALAGTSQQFGQVNYNGVGQFIVSGGQEQAQVIYAGTGSFTSSIVLLEAAGAVFAGTGSFLVDASVGKPGSAVSYNGAGAFLPTATLMLPASTSFAGAGSFIFGETLAEVSGANFAGTGRFVAGESLQLSASAYFAGAGLFTALGNVPTALPVSVFFFGTGGFIVNGAVISPIAPPILANGRWNLIMPPLDSLVVGFGFSRPILTPILNEQGFTIYFSARNLGRNARIMALQSPSGIVTRTTVFYNVGVAGLAVLTEFQVVAHVTPLNELDEPGVWEIWVENADGIRMTDSGFFTVGRLN